mgnify:FL=1
MKNRFIQAYNQAPWRTQLQWIGFFLLGLVVIVLVAGLYLSITAQATSAGVAIKNLEVERENLDRQIADLKTQYAILTSAKVKRERAEAMGYEPADPSDAVFVVVPGYTGRQPEIVALPVNLDDQSKSLIDSSYRQSLWEWLFQSTSRLIQTRR